MMFVHVLWMFCSLLMSGGLGLKEDANMTCIEKERQALLVFTAGLVNMTDFNPYYDPTNEEQKRNCCEWRGVLCNNNTGHVIGLDVSTFLNYYLLPANFSPSLQLLHHLQHLNLSGTDFQSNPIPSFLGYLTNLLSLDLSRANLSGPIPYQLANLSNLLHLNLSHNSLGGSVPHKLSNLSNLLSLDLSHNFLGGIIPFSFGNHMTSLRQLDLSRNQLQGVISKSFENCSSLVQLNLSENMFNGSVVGFVGCYAMKELILHRNAFYGGVPNIKGWSSLRTFSLAHNSLNGSIPDFTGCRSLQKLDLSSNRLTGDLPKSVGKLSNLEYLDVSSNSLNGVISDLHFLNLTKLTYLDLSFNSLSLQLSSLVRLPFILRTIKLQSCKLGPSFPTWIQSQRDFTHLDISSAGISDSIPAWFWDLPYGLKFLNLSSNEIEGMLPNIKSIFKRYPGIDLSNNHLEGIPSLPSKLAALNLSGNKFSGTLSFLCQIDEALTFLDLSNNLFSGSLPDCLLNFQKKLVILNLSNNNLSGEIPSSLGFLSHLEALYLRSNFFVGELPMSLSKCTKLRFVDLGENKLSGVIPKWIGEKLSELYVLVLGTNRFYGRIPSQLCWLYNLQLLDMSKNEVSGHIPRCFGNFTAMVRTSYGDNMTSHSYSSYVGSCILPDTSRKQSSCILPDTNCIMPLYPYVTPFRNPIQDPEVRQDCSGEPPEEAIFVDNALVAWKGTKRTFGRTGLQLLKSIDLSSNNLSGKFPYEITSLDELVSLNFSVNKLHGEVPKHMGRLKSLQSLDLSRNEFSGNIPRSLSGLTFLSYLDLSYNNLSGSIPLGPQLQLFNSTSYVGNAQLCGSPLTQRCGFPPPSPATVARKEDVKEDGDGDDFWKPYLTGMGVGFAVGFWGICGTLFLNRRCRYFFFDVLSVVKDWIYVTGVVLFLKLKRKLRR